MRDNGTVESSREFHFAGILLIGASVVAGLVLTLLVVSHEQVARAQAQPAGAADDSRAPVALFTTPTPPVVQVAVPQPVATATAAPVAAAVVPTVVSTPETSAPKTAAVASGAPAAQNQSGGDAASGAAAFGNLCGSCHPGGNAGLGPAVKGLPASVITETVRSGKGMMPPFAPPGLTDKQLLDIIAFLGSGS